MATVNFESGDTFVFSSGGGGSGIVLPCGKSLIISGEGGRTGYSVKKDSIPEDAIPGEPMRFEVKFAFVAVAAAVQSV